MILPWKKISSKKLADYRIFTVKSDVRVSPRTGKPHDFYVIDCANSVNVVALTDKNEAVIIEQFRHGSDTLEVELPGGIMDAADASPEATARRELREETGYEGARTTIIGHVHPNPAMMSNTCYTVLIEGCRKVGEPQLDAGEDLSARLVPADDLGELVASGQVRHALIIAALYQFDLWRKKAR